jgi:hypothetical protein
MSGGIVAGVDPEGKRWMKAPVGLEGRDYLGRFHALRSNDPHLYPSGVWFERAACWKTGGLECWSATSCRCDPKIDTWTLEDDGEHCKDGSPSGGLLLHAPLADTFFYQGNKFGRASSWMDCRMEQPPQINSLFVNINQGAPYQMVSLRSGDMPHTGLGDMCVANELVGCLGKTHNTACWPFQDPQYYNNHPGARGEWERMYVLENTAQIARMAVVHPEDWDADNASLDVQNAALAWAAENLSLDSLLHPRLDTFSDPNSIIGEWREGFSSSWFTGDPDGPDAPVFMSLPNSRLRHSGCPVDVTLHILSGFVAVDLVVQKVSRRIGSASDNQSWPSFRVHYHLDLGARATLSSSCVVSRPWREPPDNEVALAIENPTNRNQRLPRVEPRLDEIDFIDAQGRKFTPPIVVGWFGARQALSSGAGVWQDLWEHTDAPSQGHLGRNCCALIRALHPSTVYGMATEHLETNKRPHYVGRVKLGFWSEVDDDVPGDCPWDTIAAVA